MNLLKETIGEMLENNKTTYDVLWVGSADGEYAISWNEFKAIADFEYDSVFGWQEIAKDLIVVGNNWWLERHEYDGSEWWEFKVLPVKKENAKLLNIVETSSSWEDLSEMNIRKDKNGIQII